MVMNTEIEKLSEIIGSCNTKCDHPFDCSHCKAIRVLKAGYQPAEEVIQKVFTKIRKTCVDTEGHFLYGVFGNLYLDLIEEYSHIKEK